jgi:hypothetical protein
MGEVAKAADPRPARRGTRVARRRGMKRLAIITLLLVEGCTCERKVPPAAVAPSPVAPETIAAAPASPAPPATPPAADGDGAVGVEACDDWVRRYTACIDTKVPPAAREQMRDAVAQTAATWRGVAATAEGRAAVEAACGRMVAATRQATASFGCEW